jgi:eukaryotic-like serine/threonine-protein kinase
VTAGPDTGDRLDFAFGRYRFDRRHRRVLKDQKTVPLTARAVDTLEVLLCHAGRTVSKEELLAEVWRDTFVQEETLTQNISTIRKALGDTTDSPRYVLTVPREGYRFIAAVDMVEQIPTAAESQQFQPKTPTPTSQWPPYMARTALVLSIAAVGWIYWNRDVRTPTSGDPGVLTRFEVFEPENGRFSTAGGVLSVSPDGRYLAFLATDRDGADHLWLRPLSSLQSVLLPGTREASQPFWSPDGKSIAFFSNGSLRRVDIAGGPVQTICQLAAKNAVAGSWSKNDVILFAVLGQGIFKVLASGGTPAKVRLIRDGLCRDCLWPWFLPDGRFLFTVVSRTPERGVYVGSLDGAPPKRILEDASSVAYIDAGYLLYVSAGALVARKMNLQTGEAGADVLPVADRVWFNSGTRRGVFSASRSGVTVYREPQLSRLEWISRKGSTLSSGPEGIYHSFAAAPDGRVLVSQLDPLRGTYDLWRYDAGWSSSRAVTFDAADEVQPIWSKDDTAAVFTREEADGYQLYEVKLDRPGVEKALLPRRSRDVVGAVSWDGDVVEYSTSWPSEPYRFWTFRPAHGDPPVLLQESRPEERQGTISPDHNWVAYTANLSDSRVPNTALFIRQWRSPVGRAEISVSGTLPRWRGDGRELFFLAPGGRLMAQRIDGGHPTGAPTTLCTTEALAMSGVAGQPYDALANGQRFLIKVAARPPSIVVISNWMPKPAH